MNLCLRAAGREACQAEPQSALCESDWFVEFMTLTNLSKAVLIELLGHAEPQVCTYIHGCLYSLLARPSMRQVWTKEGPKSSGQTSPTTGRRSPQSGRGSQGTDEY
jgi:hypothetical protein